MTRTRRTLVRALSAGTAAGLLAISLTACGGSDTAGSASDCTPAHPDLKTITEGELTVASYDYAPATILEGDNVTGMITLSTIHKSKGREWKRVFWLDRLNTCPSPFAKQAWESQQEVNLQYVAATRSMSELIELSPPAANTNTPAKPAASVAA